MDKNPLSNPEYIVKVEMLKIYLLNFLFYKCEKDSDLCFSVLISSIFDVLKKNRYSKEEFLEFFEKYYDIKAKQEAKNE